MKNTYWIAIAVSALIVGLLVGYGIWGSSASKLAEDKQERNSVLAQGSESKQQVADLEANLGKITNEKLRLEKENAELKETLEKALKGRR